MFISSINFADPYLKSCSARQSSTATTATIASTGTQRSGGTVTTTLTTIPETGDIMATDNMNMHHNTQKNICRDKNKQWVFQGIALDLGEYLVSFLYCRQGSGVHHLQTVLSRGRMGLCYCLCWSHHDDSHKRISVIIWSLGQAGNMEV